VQDHRRLEGVTGVAVQDGAGRHGVDGRFVLLGRAHRTIFTDARARP
jgi:hypothetical protein